MTAAPLFCKKTRGLQRIRAAAGFHAFDFLKHEAVARLVDKLEDITRRFDTVCDIGVHHGEVSAALAMRGDLVRHVWLEQTPAMLHEALRRVPQNQAIECIIADEEWLPLRDDSLPLVMSALGLHHANDLPGVLAQIRRCLQPEGVMLAVVLGGQTLKELRDVLTTAESELYGGISPRVMPMLDVRDAGDLLSRVGFALPVAESECLEISYSDMFALMRDLRGMGETNILHARRKHCTPRALFLRAAELYQERYSNAEGRITATVELITLTGWK